MKVNKNEILEELIKKSMEYYKKGYRWKVYFGDGLDIFITTPKLEKFFYRVKINKERSLEYLEIEKERLECLKIIEIIKRAYKHSLYFLLNSDFLEKLA